MNIDNLISSRGEMELVKEKVGAQLATTDIHLQDLRVREQHNDIAWGQLVKQISGYVLSHKLIDDTINVPFSYPKTWWQHLKKRLGWMYENETVIREIKVSEVLYFPRATIVTNSPTTRIAMLGQPTVHQNCLCDWGE